MKKSFQNQNVIITGAASGLGRAFSLLLAQQNCSILMLDVDEPALLETKKAVVEAGGQGIVLAGDIGEPATWQSVAAHCREHFSSLDLLINCAGVVVTGAIGRINIVDWQWILKTNLLGCVLGCETFVPLFVSQKHGAIINIASRAAVSSVPRMAPYNVTKAGVFSLSETLYTELREHNINITVACPSFFRSQLVRNIRANEDSERELASLFINNSKRTAEQVAAEVLAANLANQLYYFPKGEDRMLWWMKRLFPKYCLKLVVKKYQESITAMSKLSNQS